MTKRTLLLIVAMLLPGVLWLAQMHGPHASAMAAEAPTVSNPADCMTTAAQDPGGRVRGWCLYRYLVDSTSPPLWSSWNPVPAGGLEKIACDPPPAPAARFAHTDLAALQRRRLIAALRPAVQIAALDLADQPANLGQAAGVFLNDGASRYLCETVRQGGSITAGMDDMLTASTTFTLPADSTPITIKTMWALMPDQSALNPPARTQQTVSVWDAAATTSPYLGSGWNTRAAIDVDDKTHCRFTPLSPAAWATHLPPTASLGCFYSIPIPAGSAPNLNTMLFDAFSTAGPSYLVLMGFHVAAKGPQGWTWQTFWWSSQGFVPGTHEAALLKDQPPLNPGTAEAWRHYVMDTTAVGQFRDGLYNPYLEAKLNQGGVQSDCVSCHALATYHPTSDASGGTDTTKCLFNQAQNTALGVAGTPCIAPATPAASLRTDNLWIAGDLNVPGVHSGDAIVPAMARRAARRRRR